MTGQRRTQGFLLDQLSVTRGDTRPQDRITTHIPTGTCTDIIGPGGAGKSTLLRVLSRLEEPTDGRVLLNGTALPDLDVLALRRRVALVAQTPVALTERVADWSPLPRCSPTSSACT